MRYSRLLVAALVCAFAAVTIPSVAAPSSEVVEHRVSVFCEHLANTDGASARLSITVSQVFGSVAGIEYWAAGTSMESDPLTYRNYESEDAPPQTITLDGLTLNADIPLVDSDFVPTGLSAQVVDAVLTPVGDPVVFDDRSHSGNHLNHFEATFQQATVSGSLQMPDGQTFDLSACSGEIEDSSRFETHPNSLINSFRGFALSCGLETEDGLLGFDVSESGGNTFAQLFFSPSSPGSTLFGFAEGIQFDSDGLDADIPVTNEFGDPVGTAVVDASFAVREIIEFDVKRSNSRERIKATLFDTTGTLILPTGLSFDLSSCNAIDLRSRLIESNPNGPRPGGAEPINDAPDGAILLAPGSKDTTRTGGAAHDPEVPCVLPTEPDPVPADFAYSVWYAVQGTGGDVTFDTAGSDYDTIIGVYTKTGTDFVQHACVDDVLVDPIGNLLQARVTIPTSVGETYYVQIGGPQFDDWPQFGRLKVAVS